MRTLEQEIRKVEEDISYTKKEIESAERYNDTEELSTLLGELKELENYLKTLYAQQSNQTGT